MAATDIFAEKGFSGARVDGIAARACINKRMLYQYFGNKEALYKAVLESAYAGIRSAEADLRLADRDPEEAMRQLTSFTWDYFLKHPEFLSLLNTENLMQGKYVRASKRIIAMHSPMIALLRDTLQQGVKAGKFRAGVDPVELYISIAGSASSTSPTAGRCPRSSGATLPNQPDLRGGASTSSTLSWPISAAPTDGGASRATVRHPEGCCVPRGIRWLYLPLLGADAIAVSQPAVTAEQPS